MKELKIPEFTLDELLHPKTWLAKMYHKKLPRRGWAGKLTPTEKEFVRIVKSRKN
jgi:hypothetical protein